MKKPYSETREERNQRAHDERKNKRGIFVGIEEADVLRDLAERLDLYTTRGPMAGQIGSMEALVTFIARTAQANPDGVLATLKAWQDAPARSGPTSPVPD